MIRYICLLLLLTSGVLKACDWPAVRIFKLRQGEVGYSIREYANSRADFRLWISHDGTTWYPWIVPSQVVARYASHEKWLSFWEKEIEKRKQVHNSALGDSIPFKTKIRYKEIWDETIRIRITGRDKIFFQLRRMKPANEVDANCMDVLPDFSALRIEDIRDELEPFLEGLRWTNGEQVPDAELPEYWVTSYEEFLEIFD